MSDLERPADHDETAPVEQQEDQDRLNRQSRSTGGDAEAAGSIAEREAVARDDDDLFSEDPRAD